MCHRAAIPCSCRRRSCPRAPWWRPPQSSWSRMLQLRSVLLGAMGNVACGRAPHVLCGDLPCHVPKMSVWVKLRTTYRAPKGSLLDVLWDTFRLTLCHFLDQFLCSFWTISCTPSLTTMELMTTTFKPIFWTAFWTTICMLFWTFFCSSWNAFWSFLGPKYEAYLGRSWAHYLP